MFSVGLVSMFANILPPPDGPGADINAIVNTLKEFNDSEGGKWTFNKFGWIIGNGYDDSQLAEKDHPKATDLDKVTPESIVFGNRHILFNGFSFCNIYASRHKPCFGFTFPKRIAPRRQDNTVSVSFAAILVYAALVGGYHIALLFNGSGFK